MEWLPRSTCAEPWAAGGEQAVIPGPPQMCTGTVWHRRLEPIGHEFRYDVSYVMFDPDEPTALTAHHWAWSTGRLRPIQLRRKDYGRSIDGSLANEARLDLQPEVPGVELGPVRLLTQPRRWGWLFNPISIFFVWPIPAAGVADGPVGLVLEVTNTPWNERHRYPLALSRDRSRSLEAQFDKNLHVSPFLPMAMSYQLRIDGDGDRIDVSLDAMDQQGRPVLRTALALTCRPASAATLARSLRHDGLTTHRVSRAIHTQAARLLGKGVPVVPHPNRRPNDGHPQRQAGRRRSTPQ